MRKLVFLVLLVTLFSFDSPPRLVKTSVTKEISMLIPKDFRPMDDLDLTQRYPSVRRPLAGYTNDMRNVDISVNISATQWPDTDAQIAARFFKSSIMNMFDGVEMLSEGIHTVHGKQFIFYEFESRVRGDRANLEFRDPVMNYTYIQYYLGADKTLVFSFTCPKRLRPDWEVSAQKIMKSIRVK
jgi:hypothetical protein